MTQPDTPPAPLPAPRRRSSRLPYVLALLAITGLIGAAWLGRANFEPLAAGAPAPAVPLRDMDGAPVDLADYRGKVVLLNVWATWCGPCLEEMPSMERLYQDMAGKDFEILAVSVDWSIGGAVPARLVRSFADQVGVTFPILYSAPEDENSIQRIYRTTGVPESFVIGKDGVIYRRISGSTSWDSPQYREQILRLLAE